MLVIGITLGARAGVRLKIRAVLAGKPQTKLLALCQKLRGHLGLHRNDGRLSRERLGSGPAPKIEAKRALDVAEQGRVGFAAVRGKQTWIGDHYVKLGVDEALGFLAVGQITR